MGKPQQSIRTQNETNILNCSDAFFKIRLSIISVKINHCITIVSSFNEMNLL